MPAKKAPIAIARVLYLGTLIPIDSALLSQISPDVKRGTLVFLPQISGDCFVPPPLDNVAAHGAVEVVRYG
jgi:hypothetical protein